jgi:AraC-like DNA-binding protein
MAEARLSRRAIDSDADLIAYAPVNGMIASALKRSACPWLGLAFGAAAQLHTHGPVGAAAIASGTVGAAMQTFTRFARLRTRALRFELQTHAAGIRLRITPAFDLGSGADFIVDALLVIVERMLESLSGQRLTSARYCLSKPRPPWVARYREFLSGAVEFVASDCTTLDFDQGLLNLPCLTADAQAHASAAIACERELDRSESGSSLAQRVQSRLRACGEHYPSAAQLAQQMHISPRNLFRRLAEEGTAYRSLVDAERLERARWLLLNTDLPVERIAERLGYGDPSNFSRTFKRWTGINPRAFREGSPGLSAQRG